MKKSKQPAHNTLSLDMRCEEGRCLVQVDISEMAENERQWLMSLLTQAEKGSPVGFGVDAGEDGAHVVKFTLGAQESVQVQ
jgi:hypothetical protein